MPEAASDIRSFADQVREQVVSVDPFTVRRVARWSECDPAGVVYAGTFAEYLLSAVALFRRRLLGRDWARIRSEFGIDLPAKAYSLVFKGSLWPDDLFDTTIRVGSVRSRTFDFLATSVRTGTGEPVFEGVFSTICVSGTDRTVAVPLPDELRQRLLRPSA